MSEVYLLNSCDAWHTYTSMELLGAFSTRNNLDEFLQAMKCAKKLSQDDYDELIETGQTFGLDTNYIVLTEELDAKYEP